MPVRLRLPSGDSQPGLACLPACAFAPGLRCLSRRTLASGLAVLALPGSLHSRICASQRLVLRLPASSLTPTCSGCLTLLLHLLLLVLLLLRLLLLLLGPALGSTGTTTAGLDSLTLARSQPAGNLCSACASTIHTPTSRALPKQPLLLLLLGPCKTTLVAAGWLATRPVRVPSERRKPPLRLVILGTMS